ncbi:hypothetical protein H0H93_013688 [Arthromyces matolae]|nr:hypothetical protein H0H93_013688 [Arthromyces matolae]
MGRQTWASADQHKWLSSKLDSFMEHQQNRKLYMFWKPMEGEYFSLWPPGEDEDIDKLKKRLCAWFNNNSQTIKKGVSTKKKVVELYFTEKSEKATRLTASQLWAKTDGNYQEKVKDKVEAEVAAQGVAMNRSVGIIRREIEMAFAAEPEHVKESIKAELLRLKEESVPAPSNPETSNQATSSPRTPQDYATAIKHLSNAILRFCDTVQDQTGFCVSIYAGGPDPSKGGKLCTVAHHVGRNPLGHNFGQAHVEYQAHIVDPYRAFLHTVFSPELCASRSLTSSSSESQGVKEDVAGPKDASNSGDSRDSAQSKDSSLNDPVPTPSSDSDQRSPPSTTTDIHVPAPSPDQRSPPPTSASEKSAQSEDLPANSVSSAPMDDSFLQRLHPSLRPKELLLQTPNSSQLIGESSSISISSSNDVPTTTISEINSETTGQTDLSPRPTDCPPNLSPSLADHPPLSSQPITPPVRDGFIFPDNLFGDNSSGIPPTPSSNSNTSPPLSPEPAEQWSDLLASVVKKPAKQVVSPDVLPAPKKPVKSRAKRVDAAPPVDEDTTGRGRRVSKAPLKEITTLTTDESGKQQIKDARGKPIETQTAAKKRKHEKENTKPKKRSKK